MFAATQSNMLLIAPSAIPWIADVPSPPNAGPCPHALLASGANTDARFVAASHPDFSALPRGMPASRRLNRGSRRGPESSSSRIGPEKSPLARTSQMPWIDGTPSAQSTRSPRRVYPKKPRHERCYAARGRSIMSRSHRPSSPASCRRRFVRTSGRRDRDVVKPSCRIARLNSSAKSAPYARPHGNSPCDLHVREAPSGSCRTRLESHLRFGSNLMSGAFQRH